MRIHPSDIGRQLSANNLKIFVIHQWRAFLALVDFHQKRRFLNRKESLLEVVRQYKLKLETKMC